MTEKTKSADDQTTCVVCQKLVADPCGAVMEAQKKECSNFFGPAPEAIVEGEQHVKS